MKGYMIYSTIDEKQTMRIYSSFKKAAAYFLRFLSNLKFKTYFNEINLKTGIIGPQYEKDDLKEMLSKYPNLLSSYIKCTPILLREIINKFPSCFFLHENKCYLPIESYDTYSYNVAVYDIFLNETTTRIMSIYKEFNNINIIKPKTKLYEKYFQIFKKYTTKILLGK